MSTNLERLPTGMESKTFVASGLFTLVLSKVSWPSGCLRDKRLFTALIQSQVQHWEELDASEKSNILAVFSETHGVRAGPAV